MTEITENFQLETKFIILKFFNHIDASNSHYSASTFPQVSHSSDFDKGQEKQPFSFPMCSKAFKNMVLSQDLPRMQSSEASHTEQEEIPENLKMAQIYYEQQQCLNSFGSCSPYAADDEMESLSSCGSTNRSVDSTVDNVRVNRHQWAPHLSALHSESDQSAEIDDNQAADNIAGASNAGDICTGRADNTGSQERSLLSLNINRPHSNFSCGEEIISSFHANVAKELQILGSEMEAVLKESEDKSGTVLTTLHQPSSPHTQTVRILWEIGDEIEERYREQLDEGIREIEGIMDINYNLYKNFILHFVNESISTWNKVALVLVCGRRLAYYLFGSSQCDLSMVVELTQRLLFDFAADFILSNGGWEAISHLDVQSSGSNTEDNAVASIENCSSDLNQLHTSTNRNLSIHDSSASPTHNEQQTGSSWHNAIYPWFSRYTVTGSMAVVAALLGVGFVLSKSLK